MADETAATRRATYPEPAYHPYAGHPPQGPPASRQDGLQRDDGRTAYSAPDSVRPPQYAAPPPPPATSTPGPYLPPQQWPAQPQHYPYPPPPPQYYDQHHQPYWHHPPPAPQDPNRLPPPGALPGYYYPSAHHPPAPPPAPKQRTAIACKYCRKRKIRCSGFENAADGRCQNCVRFNQQCLFHPVSSQAAFVPASALYGPNGTRAPIVGQDGAAPPVTLYGAHGQPLGPTPPPAAGQPYAYTAPVAHPGYSPYAYPYPPPHAQAPPPPPPPAPAQAAPPQHAAPSTTAPSDAQPAPPHTSGSDRSERASLKRGPPSEDSHNESNAAHSPHPTARARTSVYDYSKERINSASHDYPPGQTSPATSTMSYQSYPQPNTYTNGARAGNLSPPPGLTPKSANSNNSSYTASHDKTPPPSVQTNSTGSSQNGRGGMAVHEMLDKPQQRVKSDNDMLNKLDGKR